MDFMKYFGWYLAAVNRVAFLGGSFGAWAGMRYFHHKTRKKKFSVGIPLILVVEYGLAAWLMTSIK